jgi:hypothetical protein
VVLQHGDHECDNGGVLDASTRSANITKWATGIRSTTLASPIDPVYPFTTIKTIFTVVLAAFETITVANVGLEEVPFGWESGSGASTEQYVIV